MDRERDRDAVEAMIEEQDARQGGGPDRQRPGQHDPSSQSVDSQKPPKQTERRPEAQDDAPASPDPGPFAPH